MVLDADVLAVDVDVDVDAAVDDDCKDDDVPAVLDVLDDDDVLTLGFMVAIVYDINRNTQEKSSEPYQYQYRYQCVSLSR